MSTAIVPPFGAKRTGTDTARAEALRAQIESSLGDRFAGALSPAPRPVREMMPSGIAELDTMLCGGLPLGAISELVGPLSSGRTGVAHHCMAAAMREGSMCAWVDASDAFDPESAAANGVNLEQLLWVRCGVSPVPPGQSRQTASQGTMQGDSRRPLPARAGQHPRDEVRGLDMAVGELLQGGMGACRDRPVVTPGTPGAPNRPLGNVGANSSRSVSGAGDAGGRGQGRPSFRPVRRDEQVSLDRQPRRGRDGAGQGTASAAPAHGVQPEGWTKKEGGEPAHLVAAGAAEHVASGAGANRWHDLESAKPWARLDQALRAADLLLQAGGFRVLVLDFGSIAPEYALRIPLATWFRFRAAADTHRTVLLALTQTSCARSSAGLVVSFDALEAQSTRASLDPPAAARNLLQFVEQRPATNQLANRSADLGRASETEQMPGTLLASMRYQARPLRQRFTPSPMGMDRQAARREPQATWQLSAYAFGEQLA